MKRPSFQFYPGDWLSVPELRACSVGARGAWIDMICLMHQGEPYGHLTINGKGILTGILARILGCTLEELERYLEELESAGVFSRTEEGVIFSRRMIRDEEIREKRASGGYKALDHPNVAKPKKGKQGKGYPSRISLDTPSAPSLDPSPSSPSSSPSSKEKTCVEVFDYWKTTLDHPRAILDPKRKRLIEARLDQGFSISDLKAAIDGCKSSPWHMGENDRNQRYDGIDLIFRDADHVENFIGKLGVKVVANGGAESHRPPVVTAPPEWRKGKANENNRTDF